MRNKIFLALVFIIFVFAITPSKAVENDSLILVSRSTVGLAVGGVTSGHTLSADGRYVAFISSSADLVPNDTNELPDLFVFDRITSSVTRASVATDWTQSDGPVWGGRECQLSMSADGRYVTFESTATNLVPNDTNGQKDIFVRDFVANTTSRVSISSNGTEGISKSWDANISANGRYIAFVTWSVLSGEDNDLDDSIYVHDRETGATEYLPIRYASCPVISSDGRYVAFISKDKLVPEIYTYDDIDKAFVYDRVEHTFTWLSKPYNSDWAKEESYSPSISETGRYITFVSKEDDITPSSSGGDSDTYLYDQITNEMLVIDTPYNSWTPMVSSNGRFLLFVSSNEGMHEVTFYLYNIDDTSLEAVSLGNWDTGSLPLQGPSVSNDGAFISFYSLFDGLVPEDNNGLRDVFLIDRRMQVYTNHVYLPVIIQ